MTYRRLALIGLLLSTLLSGYAQDTLQLPTELARQKELNKTSRIDADLLRRMQLRSVDSFNCAITTNILADSLLPRIERLSKSPVYAAGYLVNARLDATAIRRIADWETVRYLRRVFPPQHRSGDALSQGDAALGTDAFRQNRGLLGSGVKIGVLSDSYNARNGAMEGVQQNELLGRQNTNGFNQPVDILRDVLGGTDEGRAMLEIVHDVAPGATLAFATALGGQAAFASAIRELREAGCDIIVDDIGYFAEPFFLDGIVAQVVDEVNADGAVYLSSAGNNDDQSYETNFTEGGTIDIGEDNYRAHAFGPDDIFQEASIPAGDSILLSFQWDDRFASVGGFPGAGSDLDIFLVDSARNSVVAASTLDNMGNDPVEILSFRNPADADSQTFHILIGIADGAVPARIKYISFRSLQINEFDTQSGTCYGHPNAEGALAIGAAFWFFTPAFGESPPRLEPFSSRGGIPILRDSDGNSIRATQRDKPNVVGPDGGNTSFFGQQINDGDNFPNFFGTSASAPHLAALVALLLEAIPQADPGDIRLALETSAIDMETPGFDFDSGFGYVATEETFRTLSSLVIPLELPDILAFEGQATVGGNRIDFALSGTDNLDSVRIFRGVQQENLQEFVRLNATQEAEVLDEASELEPLTFYQLELLATDGTIKRSAVIQIQRFLYTEELLIFPNPSPGQVTIRIPGGFRPEALRLIDMLGRDIGINQFQPLVEGQQVSFNLANLSPGTYYLGFPEQELFQTLLIQP